MDSQNHHASAAVAMQVWWHRQLVQQALCQAVNNVLSIQTRWREAIAQQREERRYYRWVLSVYLRLESVSVILQVHARMWNARTQYKKYQKAAQTIQNRDGVDLNIKIIIGKGAPATALMFWQATEGE
uniref:Uncharacterized protein n=1 Tax=Nothoprocta perdicaria TaxID=30464 RepID=A0A8C6ZWI7_NOTPE